MASVPFAFNEYIPYLKDRSKLLKFDPAVFAAIVHQESKWVKDAMRFEPNAKDFFLVPTYALQNRISKDTEKALQAFSYGLGQIMGYTARRLNYELMLPGILEAYTNLDLCTQLFSNICKEFSKKDDQISVYNFGHVSLDDGKYRNQPYVDSVNSFIPLFSPLLV